ncbi:MAG: YeeE/YedE family protein [Ramlibacter sp.]
MSLPADPASLARLVVFGALALGVVLGAVGQATRFCTRGAVADWVEFRSPGRAMAWLLAIAVGAVLVQGLIAFGLVDGTRVLSWSDRLVWLSALVGGLLFGAGMILAQGCPQRALVKAGSGNLKAALTLVVIAVAAAMTLRGLFAVPRVELLDRFNVALGAPQDLGTLIGAVTGASPQAVRWTLAWLLLAGVVALGWRLRRAVARGDWVGGVVVGALVAAALYLTGHLGFLAEHPETLEPAWLGTQSRRPEGLSFAAPMAHALDLLTLWTDKSMVATFGVMLALGVLVGSAVSARLRGEFKLESFRGPREIGEHVAGGVLMGFGGVTALGCSVGNGVTGMAMLSSGALLATAGIVAGAWGMLRWQRRAARPATAGLAAAR